MTEKQMEGIAAIEAHETLKEAAASLGISNTALRQRVMPVRPDLFPNSAIAHSIMAQTAAASDEPTPAVEPMTGGFSLQNRNVLAAKPTDIWKARFYGLKKGMGYTIEHLADQWGNSIDTIKSKAKRFGALRYVENINRPGNYIACVVHPETPKGR